MTFSIIARDVDENKIGISICSAIPFIGKYSLFVFPSLGAVTAQGKLDPNTAFTIRDMIIQGKNSQEINDFLKSKDSAYNRKQTAFINLKKGELFSYTGSDLLEKKTPLGPVFGGTKQGKNYIISGNHLSSLETLDEMEKCFLQNKDKPLEERLILTLEAGNATKGDLRGRQSAAIQVFEADNEYPKVTIDIDDHLNPVEELRRIFNYAQENWQFIPDTCFVGKDFNYEKIWENVDWETIMPKIDKFEKHVSDRKK